MAKNSVTDYDTTAANNTDVGGIAIEGSDNVANFDNALREIMKQIADLNTGASFIHDTYKIADSDAETKLAKFDASSITAGQTRSFAFPDKDGTLAVTDDIVSQVLDEDDFSSDSTTKAPSQQSTAAFIASEMTASESSLQAWVNMDGTGVISIRDDLNVSSLTDGGTGLYSINYGATFANTNYAFQFVSRSGSYSSGPTAASGLSTGSTNVEIRSGSNSLIDRDFGVAMVSGVLA